MQGIRTDGDVVLRSLCEPEAFGELFDRHFDDVRAYFARRLDVEVAADLAAEVFRLGFEKRRTFDPQRGSSCRPWLFGIARNLLAKERARAGRRDSLIARLAPAGDAGHPANDAIDDRVAALDAAREWRQVAAALDELPDDTRELLLLLAWDSLTYEELAQVFAVPVGTIRSRVSRARDQLTRLIERTPCHD
jgi:RNA polymerase sigma-70 factor (ECF subfamily)